MRTCRAFVVALLLVAAAAAIVRADETARADPRSPQGARRHDAQVDRPPEHLKMTIRDGRGGERQRELTLYERRLPGDERQTIVFFESPAEVKGTAFLAYTHAGQPAEQWLYLPELKRIRQIAARSRTESFVGTDLSYQDLDIIQEMASWSDADARAEPARRGDRRRRADVRHRAGAATRRHRVQEDRAVARPRRPDAAASRVLRRRERTREADRSRAICTPSAPSRWRGTSRWRRPPRDRRPSSSPPMRRSTSTSTTTCSRNGALERGKP